MTIAKEKVVDTKDKSIPAKDAIVTQAKARFRDVTSYERSNRIEATDDLNMLAGINHWPKAIKIEREAEGRPVLTINKLPAFVDQVINDARLNKISIKIKPCGGGATKELADTFNGLIRNIENVSDADVAYLSALEGAVNNGFGYFRIITTFVDDDSFDQVVRIKRIRNPMTVYFDHAHVEHDGRDARYVFITEMVSKEEYKVRYNKDIAPFSETTTDEDDKLWVEEDRVRVAEYWVKEPVKKSIYLLDDDRVVNGDEWDKIADDLEAEYGEQMMQFEEAQAAQAQAPPQPSVAPPVDPAAMMDPQAPVAPPAAPPTMAAPAMQPPPPPPQIVKKRVVDSHKVVQYLIDGEGIIEGPTDWLGKYIPVIPVWGRELVIGEEKFLRGLIRFAKDPQRMYNYFRTAATETVALAPKAPYIGTAEQFETHKEDWESANRKNLPFLAYDHQDGVAPPQRQIVTQTAIGEITEANISNDEMKSTTSLYDASLGAQGNETSGRAIIARQREGDIANFVFHDNLKRGIKYAGDILIDLLPKVYDTNRQEAVIKDDESEEMVYINNPVLNLATLEVIIINDLSVGKYKVVASTGPSFSTQREEAVQSMMDFVRVAPEAAGVIIDLIAEAMDWPGSTKMANRLRKLLELQYPGIDEEGPMQPQGPDVEQITKEQKLEGTMLGNILKKLDIIMKKEEINNPEPKGGGGD